MFDQRHWFNAAELAGLSVVDLIERPGGIRHERQRDLRPAQKRELIANLLKAGPERSNRLIAELAEVDHKTVAVVRWKLESSGQIPRLKKRIGKDRRSRGYRSRVSTEERAQAPA